MTNFTKVPLQDRFETTLAQTLAASGATAVLSLAPSVTSIPVGQSMIVGFDYDNGSYELRLCTAISGVNLTLDPTPIARWYGDSPSSSQHSSGAKVIISHSWEVFEDIRQAISSKVDKGGDTMTGPLVFTGTTNRGVQVASLTTTQRDALVGVGNGTIIYNSTIGDYQVYNGGSWYTLAAGSTQPNASETVAGKIELATNAEMGTSTSTGGSGARLVPPNDQLIQDRSVYTPAKLTGGTNAQNSSAVWAPVNNGSFRITINGVSYNIDGINFAGAASMANVATIIQTALRAVTGSTETVTWVTNHFEITSANTTSSSAITVTTTSTGTVGTDISGAGASDWMDADTGHGVVTAAQLNPAGDANKLVTLDSTTGRYKHTFMPIPFNFGGDGQDGDLTVSGTTTLNLNQVYNIKNLSVTGTLTFTGSGSIALMNVSGNFSGNGTIELRNTSSADPSVYYFGGTLALRGGNAGQATAPNTGGTGGGNGGSITYGGNGGNGGTSTSAGAGTAGSGGAAGASGTDGGGGASTTGGGGGGGGGAQATNAGSNGVAASGLNGGNGGAGGTGAANNVGGKGGGGGGGFNTGNGGNGGNAGTGSTWTNSATMPNDNATLSGGAGGASGANGGNGGAGGAGGPMTNSSAGGGGVTYKAGNGGAGGWGYSLGGAGGAGGLFTHSASGGITAEYGGNGGNGGHSSYGTGGAGGNAGGYTYTTTAGTAFNTLPTAGIGGNGRAGGAGGTGCNISGSGLNLTGGAGGAGGQAKNGCAAIIIQVKGNCTFTGTINGQGGNGGNGGAGGTSTGTVANSSGGAGGAGADGADVVILSIGTMSAMTINNTGGAGGNGGAAGTGATGAAGSAGATGAAGRNGIKIAQQVIF